MTNPTFFALIGLVALVAQVSAHGHLSVPANRGYTHTQDVNNAPVAFPLNNNFVCRGDPAMPSNMWTSLTAGSTTPVQWSFEAPHPGDCFAYLSYDSNLPDNQKKWFKIAQWNDCNYANMQTMQMTIPSYLPSCDHCILRWEWYALHLQSIGIVEYYAQCADVKIQGSSNGQLPTPQVTIPGHLPMDAQFYRNEYSDPDEILFTGPPVASVGGAAWTCTSAYGNSCNVAAATNNPCVISSQKCVSPTTYQACGIGTTTTIWEPAQSCQTGTVCVPNPDGVHIMCVSPSYVPPPSTPAPNTPAPNTPAPNTPAPNTPAPNTPAPNTPAPNTPAPNTPAPNTPAPNTTPSDSCILGYQKCIGPSTYQGCAAGRNGNYWAAAQSCQSGLYCVPNGNNIYCQSNPAPVGTTTASTTARAASTTARAASTTARASSTTARAASTTARTASTTARAASTTHAPAPASSTTGAASCPTLGYQVCTGTSTYQTCGNGVNGPAWSADQHCQAGLTCHPSATANNIYCY